MQKNITPFKELAEQAYNTGNTLKAELLWVDWAQGEANKNAPVGSDSFVHIRKQDMDILIPLNRFYDVDFVALNARRSRSIGKKLPVIDTMRHLVKGNLHSIFDYVITDVTRDENGKIISPLYGDRIAAQDKLRQDFWLAKSGDGYRVNEGESVIARVIATPSPRSVIIEMHGVTRKVLVKPNTDAEGNEVNPYSNGGKIRVRITSIVRYDASNHVRADFAEEELAPREQEQTKPAEKTETTPVADSEATPAESEAPAPAEETSAEPAPEPTATPPEADAPATEKATDAPAEGENA